MRGRRERLGEQIEAQLCARAAVAERAAAAVLPGAAVEWEQRGRESARAGKWEARAGRRGRVGNRPARSHRSCVGCSAFCSSSFAHSTSMTVTPTTPGANAIRTTARLANLILDKNVDIPLKDGGLCRANVYRPLQEGRYPCILTMGPYGKDAPYAQFHVKSYRELPDEQKGPLSAWETPHPDVRPLSISL